MHSEPPRVTTPTYGSSVSSRLFQGRLSVWLSCRGLELGRGKASRIETGSIFTMKEVIFCSHINQQVSLRLMSPEKPSPTLWLGRVPCCVCGVTPQLSTACLTVMINHLNEIFWTPSFSLRSIKMRIFFFSFFFNIISPDFRTILGT